MSGHNTGSHCPNVGCIVTVAPRGGGAPCLVGWRRPTILRRWTTAHILISIEVGSHGASGLSEHLSERKTKESSVRTVADVMQKDVITVSRNTSVRELIQLMTEESISGVPVLDESRRVVGVVSQTDVVRLAASQPELQDDGDEVFPAAYLSSEDETSEDDWPEAFFTAPEEWGFVPAPSLSGVPAAPFDDVPVTEIMTPVAYAVSQEMEIPEAARFMADGRIHRALVVDDDTLVGIVTTFDLLRVLAEGGGSGGG